MGGVDLVTPAEEFSAGAWLRAAADWATGIPDETPIVIVGGTGLYFSALLRGLDRAWTKPPPAYPVLKINRAVVRQRIAARLDDMFVAGLEEEKRRLKAQYPVWSKTAALAIGYREGDDREKIFIRTCQLAKRQDTWFRHQASALYVEPTVEIDAAHMITPMVKNNYGIGITPKSLVKDAIDKGDVFQLKLKDPLPSREVVAVINKNHPQSALIKRFVENLKE
jgi:tRNA A37 N6-isopentenylltransferase MiaA